ncbi:MAG: SPOR domain-containing protein, partial [Pseudomonadota bacterium]
TEENSGSGSTVVAPRVVQTLTVKPDGTILQTPSQPVATPNQSLDLASQNPTLKQASEILTTPNPVQTQPITPSAQQPETTAVNQNNSDSALETSSQANNAPAIQPSDNTATEEPTQLAAIDGAVSTGETGIPTASPLPKPKPKPVAKPKPAPATNTAAVAKSEWVVQVSSQTTPEAAQSSFVNMRNRFSALQGRAMSIQRANVNGTTYYRVRVQTASRNDANQLCANLKSAGGSCFVTR